MKNLIFLSILVFALTSCATTEYYMADDVYVVKPSNLPLGESTADETSYAAFKKRQIDATNERQVYSDNRDFRMNQDRFSNFGNNYYIFLYSSQFPYSFGYNYFLMGGNSWMGYNSWDTQIFMRDYYGWNNGYWNGSSYGYNYYNNWYYGNGGFWCPQWGYGYGGNGFGWNGYGGYGAVYTAQNQYHGPRGSYSGYSNPNGRLNTGKLKSGVAYSPNGDYTSARNTSNNKYERKPISSVNQNRVYQNNTNSSRAISPVRNSSTRPTTPTRETSPARTYERSDATTRPKPTIYNSGNGNSRGRTNGTTNSGRTTIERSSSDYNRNSGTINSGSSGSRSTGGTTGTRSSSSTNSGRRP